MVEALKLLTERSNTPTSIQSSILATIKFLKLHMIKLVADMTLIRNQLNIAENVEESITVGAPEEPTEAAKHGEFFATADKEEEEVEEEEGELEAEAAAASASATSDENEDV